MLAMQPTARSNLIPVRRSQVDFFFPEAWALIEPAVARNGLYTQEAVLNSLRNGEFQLWCAEIDHEMVMALVTEIASYPARKVCTAVFAGGREIDQCLPLLAEIETWAREEGCDRMMVNGRRGWLKKLGGYRESDTAVVKDFHDA